MFNWSFSLSGLKPAVSKKWLILLSGFLWSFTGILLIWIALKWFVLFNWWQIIMIVVAGSLLGLSIAWLGFSNLAKKNVQRIWMYREKVCLFAFQRWQMYFLIAVMMSLGSFMRGTDLIPKSLLAAGYIGIGSALFLASFVYYKILWMKK